MLWNWHTIDACFVSPGWHVTTPAGFAMSCLGAWGLVIVLEFLRRLSQEYDIWLGKKRMLAQPRELQHIAAAAAAGGNKNEISNGNLPTLRRAPALSGWGKAPGHDGSNSNNTRRFKLTMAEQAIRASLYTMQAGLAYFVMLLAMSFNGFVLLCMFAGAFTGYFAFHWVHFGDE